MRKGIKKPNKRRWGSVYRNFIQLILVGSVTGIFAGAAVTAFNILAEKGEEISRDAYAFVRNAPAFIPVLLLVLLLGAFFISALAKTSTMIRGCGIPQAEGAARGAVRFKWWRDATAMFAAALVSIFMGLSIGAEGPSAFIGAGVGDGVASLTHRNEMIKKYQVTGGACTGLAVASNAPLTGIVFAFEEAHKRFTPEVFICAFSSVVFGILTRTMIYGAFGMEIRSAFDSYAFHALPFGAYGFVVAAGIVCGFLGVFFHKLCFLLRRLFKKIGRSRPQYKYFLRIAIAVFLGGGVALLTTGVMGGGHALIESLGTNGGTHASQAETVLGGNIGVLVFAFSFVLVMKLLVTAVNVGSGLPCGIFIPIIAIGACLGGLLNLLWGALGMDAAHADLMVMICMAAFFATIVRAPLTAMIMICELTGSFAPLLPVVIAVSIGYTIGEMSKTDGIYEELLEAYEHENGIHANAVQEVYTLTVEQGALADRRAVRDVLWPMGVRVAELRRGEEIILPAGDTVLLGGDVLTIACKTDDPKRIKDELEHILG